LRSEFCDEARQPLGPDPHFEAVLLHVHTLDQQLDDACLLGGEQLVPNRGEVGEQESDLALGGVVLALALRPVQLF
jgi:hypothetical protein